MFYKLVFVVIVIVKNREHHEQMIAMTNRILDGSMNDVKLADIIDATTPLSDLHQRLYSRMLLEMRRVHWQRCKEAAAAVVAVRRTSSLHRHCQHRGDWLVRELDEMNELIQIGCPMAFIVLAAQYAPTNSVACAIATAFYYRFDMTRLTDEQQVALSDAFPDDDDDA